jgi:hypothetical protein
MDTFVKTLDNLKELYKKDTTFSPKIVRYLGMDQVLRKYNKKI